MTVGSRAAGQLAAAPRSLGSARPHETVEVKLGCSFEVRRGTLPRSPAGRRPCSGIPYDRPVVGYGGRTINTLRLWAAAAPDVFDFQEFSAGDFRRRTGRAAHRRDR